MTQVQGISSAVERSRLQVERRVLALREAGLPVASIARRLGRTVRFVRGVIEATEGRSEAPALKVKRVRRPTARLMSQADRSVDFLNGVRWVRASLAYHRDLDALKRYLGEYLALPRRDETEDLCRFCAGRHSARTVNADDLDEAKPQWRWLADQGVSVERIAELIGVRPIVVASAVEGEKNALPGVDVDSGNHSL